MVYLTYGLHMVINTGRLGLFLFIEYFEPRCSFKIIFKIFTSMFQLSSSVMDCKGITRDPSKSDTARFIMNSSHTLRFLQPFENMMRTDVLPIVPTSSTINDTTTTYVALWWVFVVVVVVVVVFGVQVEFISVVQISEMIFLDI